MTVELSKLDRYQLAHLERNMHSCTRCAQRLAHYNNDWQWPQCDPDRLCDRAKIHERRALCLAGYKPRIMARKTWYPGPVGGSDD
jgi:hypothetical protein